jgi:tetratricopeptide (TPR) repeat protein
MKKNTAFWVFFLSFVISAVPVMAQPVEEYNPWALEYFKRSLEYLVTGDYTNAISSCNEVLRRDPNSSVTYTIRARAYFESGYYDNAIADCTLGIRIDRNNIGAFSIRANAYARKGDRTRAIADWQAVLRLNPDNNEARQNIELAQTQ